MSNWWDADAAAPATAAASNWWDKDKQSAPVKISDVAAQAFEGIPILGGLGPKIRAGVGAAVTGIDNAVPALGAVDKAVQNSPALRALSGGLGFGLAPTGELSQAPDLASRYKENLASEDASSKAFEEAHPVITAGARIGGAIATTAPLAASSTGAQLLGLTGTLPQMVGRGALSSAAISGADALVRGENPISPSLIGGGVGAIAPVVGRVISAAAQPLTNAVRGIINPAGEAGRRVATAIERDVKSGAGLSDAEFSAAQHAGEPVALIDKGGETTRQLARSAANTSPEGFAALNKTINDRFESQSQRLSDWFNGTFNYPTEAERQKVIRGVAQNVYEPRYAQAYKDSANKNLWFADGAGKRPDADLANLVQAPEVQTAIRIATPQLRNWAVRDGLRPPVGAFKIEDGITKLTETASGNLNLPSLQYWDYIKRGLDGMGTPTSKQFAKVLRDKLDDLVPSYKAARDSALPTKFFDGAPNAFEAGRNFINRGERFGPNAQVHLGNMTQDERKLFADGYVSQLVERVARSPDRRNVVNSLYNSPAAKRELEMAVGPQRAKDLEAKLRVEGLMDLARGAVQGNSTTARQLMHLGLAGGVGVTGSIMSGGLDPTSVMSAALLYGAARGRNVINTNVSRQVAELLTSSDPQKLANGIRMITHNSNLLSAIRNTDAALAAIAARSATPALMH